MGTINADDLVASVQSKSSPGNNSLVGEKNVDRQAGSADRSGGQHKGKILGPQEHDQIKTTAEKYSCQKCNKIFSSLYWFQNHTILCGHPLPCEKCNKTFKNVRCLNKHIKVYHGDQFRCLDCGECFATEKKLRVHEKKTHVQICPWCKVESKNIRALRKHVKKNCKGKKLGDVKQFETIMSNDSEVDRNEKVNAVEISSPKKMEKGNGSLLSKLPNKVQKMKKYLKSTKHLNCQECHKSYKTPSGLRKHIKTHTKATRKSGPHDIIFENNLDVEHSVPVEIRSAQSETGTSEGEVLLGEISVPVLTVSETRGSPVVEYTVSQVMEQEVSGVCVGPIECIAINTD